MHTYPPLSPDTDDDREPFLQPSAPGRQPRPSPPTPLISRFASRRGCLLLAFCLPGLTLLLLAVAGLGTGEEAAGLRPDWREKTVAMRLKEGLEGLTQGWAGLQSWGWLETGLGGAGGTEGIEVDMLPSPKAPPPYDPEERFLGYLPHSGFHN
ncbi:hypothetical protein JCM10213_004852 [Rhodosporidiobolus nylandii]